MASRRRQIKRQKVAVNPTPKLVKSLEQNADMCRQNSEAFKEQYDTGKKEKAEFYLWMSQIFRHFGILYHSQAIVIEVIDMMGSTTQNSGNPKDMELLREQLDNIRSKAVPLLETIGKKIQEAEEKEMRAAEMDHYG